MNLGRSAAIYRTTMQQAGASSNPSEVHGDLKDGDGRYYSGGP